MGAFIHIHNCPQAPNNTGAYRIAWRGPEGTTYRLEENGRVIYEGPHQASTVTGNPEGAYVYQVGVADGPHAGSWSVPCPVAVSPPSLSLALGLFGMGLLVFLSVLVVVIRGHRAHRRGELG